MTWTYDADLINSTSNTSAAKLMQVRFLVQDVSSENPLVQDEEIDWLLARFPNVFEAAAAAARSIGGRMAQAASVHTVADATLSFQRRAANYFDLADLLIMQARHNRHLLPYAGGISKSDKAANARDTDWAKPAFAVGMQRHPAVDRIDWLFPST